MRIKKHPSGNQFILADGVWVRNFAKTDYHPLAISNLVSTEECELFVKNMEANKALPNISTERIEFRKMVIVSDGYKFEERHEFLSQFASPEFCVLAVNKAHLRWKLYGPQVPAEKRLPINAYVVNNPFNEAVQYLPTKATGLYYPHCIASQSTNAEFMKKYKGDIYTYATTPNEHFGYTASQPYFIDDYRNPICAAIGLAYRFKVNKVLLLSCDDSFEEQREFAVQLVNGLWTYPQHLKSQRIIDANLYWLTHQEEREVQVANYSSGAECVNAQYITCEQEAIKFLQDSEEGTNDVQ